jgi:hypothetical protein
MAIEQGPTTQAKLAAGPRTAGNARKKQPASVGHAKVHLVGITWRHQHVGQL